VHPVLRSAAALRPAAAAQTPSAPAARRLPPHAPSAPGALLQARRRARATPERAQRACCACSTCWRSPSASSPIFSSACARACACPRSSLSAAGVVARRRRARARRVRRQFVSGDTHNFPAATRAIGRTATGKLCVSPPNAPLAEQALLAQPFVLRERWTPKRLSSPLRGGDGGGGDGDVLSERARAFLKRRRRHPHPRPRPARGRGEARVRSRRGAFAP
jgi:hypothetical protein